MLPEDATDPYPYSFLHYFPSILYSFHLRLLQILRVDSPHNWSPLPHTKPPFPVLVLQQFAFWNTTVKSSPFPPSLPNTCYSRSSLSPFHPSSRTTLHSSPPISFTPPPTPLHHTLTPQTFHTSTSNPHATFPTARTHPATSLSPHPSLSIIQLTP